MAGLRFEDIAAAAGYQKPSKDQSRQSAGASAPPPPHRVGGFTGQQKMIGLGLFAILMVGFGMGKSSSPDPKVTCNPPKGWGPTTTTEQVSR